AIVFRATSDCRTIRCPDVRSGATLVRHRGVPAHPSTLRDGVVTLTRPVRAGRRACRTRCRRASARTGSLRAAPITMSGADPSADQHRRSSMDARPGRVQLPMLQSLRRPSIIDQAELELRTAIYDGSLRPGDAVPEVAVSRQMGISRSSLREACQRLVRDGLLTQHPGRGLFVTRMDAATMSD